MDKKENIQWTNRRKNNYIKIFFNRNGMTNFNRIRTRIIYTKSNETSDIKKYTDTIEK